MDIAKQIKESIRIKEGIIPLAEDIVKIGEIMAESLARGNKILVAGNGGSATDAQHLAGELVGRFKKERKALPCIALTTDASILTALSNDYDFSTVFQRQVEALGKPGDIFLGISTSGNSENIINAVSAAKAAGMKIVLLLGRNGGRLKTQSEHALVVPSDETPRVQESHILIIHILCDYIEQSLFGELDS